MGFQTREFESHGLNKKNPLTTQLTATLKQFFENYFK